MIHGSRMCYAENGARVEMSGCKMVPKPFKYSRGFQLGWTINDFHPVLYYINILGHSSNFHPHFSTRETQYLSMTNSNNNFSLGKCVSMAYMRWKMVNHAMNNKCTSTGTYQLMFSDWKHMYQNMECDIATMSDFYFSSGQSSSDAATYRCLVVLKISGIAGKQQNNRM